MTDPFSSYRLGPVTLRNRFVKAATFEGLTGDRTVNDRLIAFHREMAAGGVAMTTVAFCAVSKRGRATPNELILTAEAVTGFRALADAVHDEGAALSVQVGHAGAVAGAAGMKGLSPSPIVTPLAFRRSQEATRAELDEIAADFAAGCLGLVDNGVDCIELHLGHGYLLSEFLSPKLNKRTDDYGGTLENRSRFPRLVVERVRAAVGDRAAVIAKLNMDDGVAGGFWVDESVEMVRMLEADGALDAVELTCGSSLQNPMYLFRGEAPIREMAATMPKALRPAVKLFGGMLLKEYPYEDLYLLPMARQVRAAVDLPLVLLGGISDLAGAQTAMDEGFQLVAMGRALLREPDLINRLREGDNTSSLCIHCNKCMATIYEGTNCVLR